MIIDIPDDIDPLERRQRLKFDPVYYALEKYENDINKAAEFLGYTARNLRDKMHQRSDLKKLIAPTNYKRYSNETTKDCCDLLAKKRDLMLEKLLNSPEFWSKDRKEQVSKISTLIDGYK